MTLSRPVQLLERRLGCKNTKFDVFLDHIAEPSGHEVNAYLVVNPNATHEDDSLQPIAHYTGVAIIPVMDGAIGLQQMFRHVVGDWLWELPRGFIDTGERPEQAALRELEEESGLIAQPENLISLGSIMPEPGVIRARTALFAAQDCKASGRAEGEIGLGQFRWFTVEDAIAMALDGGIQCSTTCAALLRYAALRQNSR